MSLAHLGSLCSKLLYLSRWVEQYCMLVSDIPNEIELHVFSQPVNVPASLTIKSKEATPAEYALRSSGYAKSIIEVWCYS